jgi:hypothetical protein
MRPQAATASTVTLEKEDQGSGFGLQKQKKSIQDIGNQS